MQTVDASYSEWLEAASTPRELRVIAGELPFRLGLTKTADGRWGDFIRLDPDRDLPLYATRPGMAEASLNLFLRAHHIGGFYGVLRDRLLDGQVEPSAGLTTIGRALLRAWVDALAAAIGKREVAKAAIVQVLKRARIGAKMERDMRLGRSHFSRYALSTHLKLDWITLAARMQLDMFGDHAGARAFTRAFHRVLLALQCRDDVDDAVEDRRLHGISMADALGISENVLFRTSVHLFRDAARLARLAGFSELAAWSTAQLASCERFHFPSAEPRNEDLQALLLSWCADGEDPVRPQTTSTSERAIQ